MSMINYTLLKQLRKENNLNQEDIAKIIKVSRQTYAKIEKWDIELSLWWAVKLADFFEKKVSDFITESKWDNTHQFSLEKYTQVITNLIKYGSSNDGQIPKTKLAKLCYFADFWRYYDNLTSMTGQIYLKYTHWPVGKDFLNILENMLDEEIININYQGNAHLLSNILEPKNNLLSWEEIKILKKIGEKWRNKSSWEAEEFTHNQLPWSMTEWKMQEIPYAFITQEEPENVY